MIIQNILIFLINNFIFINTMELNKDVSEKLLLLYCLRVVELL